MPTSIWERLDSSFSSAPTSSVQWWASWQIASDASRTWSGLPAPTLTQHMPCVGYCKTEPIGQTISISQTLFLSLSLPFKWSNITNRLKKTLLQAKHYGVIRKVCMTYSSTPLWAVSSIGTKIALPAWQMTLHLGKESEEKGTSFSISHISWVGLKLFLFTASLVRC